MSFVVGQVVTVNDPNNWYRGRVAKVKYVNNEFGTLYVLVKSASGNAEIGFNLKQAHAGKA